MHKKIIVFGVLTIFTLGVTIGTVNQSELQVINLIAIVLMTICGIACFTAIASGIRTYLIDLKRLSEDGITQQAQANEAQLNEQKNATQLMTGKLSLINSKIADNAAQLSDDLSVAIERINHTLIKELRSNADQVVSASSDATDKLDAVTQEIIESVVLSSNEFTAGINTLHENTKNDARKLVTDIGSIHDKTAKQLIVDVQTLTNDLTKHNAVNITKLGDNVNALSTNIAGSITKLGNSEEALATRIDQSYKELQSFASVTLADGMKVVQEQAQEQNESITKLLLIATQKQEEALEKMTSELQNNSATTLEDFEEVITKALNVIKRSNENLTNTLEETNVASAKTMGQLIEKYAEFEAGYQKQYKYFQTQTDALTKLNTQDIKVLEKIANGKSAV